MFQKFSFDGHGISFFQDYTFIFPRYFDKGQE